MKITISGKQMTVRDSLKTTVEKKLRKFDKFFGDEAEAFVTCKVRKGTKIIEITIPYGGRLYRSEEEDETFLTALDRATATLEGQIRRNKTRLEKAMRADAFLRYEPEDDEEYEEEPEFRIRQKSYPTRPMTAEEAILQMNLTDHTFFVFVHAEGGETCVVYKKKDGDYGLLTPGND